MRNLTFTLAGWAGSLVFAGAISLHAQVLIDPTIEAYSSQMTVYQGGSNLERQANNLVNGSGLTAGASGVLGASDSTANSVANGTEWWSVGNTNGATPATPDYAPSLTFDLGAEYNLTNLLVWNENEDDSLTGNTASPIFGAKSVEILAGASLTSLSVVGTYTFNEGTAGTTPELPQNISLALSDVQYVQFDILSNWDGATFTGDAATSFAGNTDNRGLAALSEIRFEGDVPEPSTFALMAGAAGLVFLAVRRRLLA